ncbi:Rieske 2Fe-2S domain-containing protein [Bordetella bronchiseptica]|uniref:Rieske 2Fe-2S domain-containing protein n=1 Tax=Bordetella bronchiseptica TaxID=518 RepID=UPI003F745951
MNAREDSRTVSAAEVPLAFSGYKRRDEAAEDAEITHVLPGTPMGEYLRRFWQPVCLSNQLKDIPHPIRILGEDLVAFRDLSGQVSVMHRHCAHRGASLEYGVIQHHGIRCCYHGFHYAIDGTLLEAPTEPDKGAKLCKTVCQGAYPAFERNGLVFAYMGPPEHRPPFEEWDSFAPDGETELLPFTNVFPCNWLQILDNIGDQMHTSVLHQPATLFPGPPPADLDLGPLTLPSFGSIPVIDYFPVRDSTAMVFVAGRRTSDDLVWWRMNECALPNITNHAYLFEDGKQRRLFHRVHMIRWYVPVDNTHSIVFGWRMFGKKADPLHKGRRERVGWNDMDFLEGQVNNRPDEVARRAPGDYEVIVGQRPIAIHALENPTSGDVGVYMFRRILRDAVRGTNNAADPHQLHARLREGHLLHTATQNTILKLARRADEASDRKMIREVGRALNRITAESDAFGGAERDAFIAQRYEEIESQWANP